MFRTPLAAAPISPSIARLMAFVGQPLPAALDLCEARAPEAAGCDGLRFAAHARRSSSPHAFRPSFTPDDWRAFAGFCIARRLPADVRLRVPGRIDRALCLVVEGSLVRHVPGTGPRRALLPGTIVGEDALFSEAPGDLDVRTLDDTRVLELPLPRQRELAAACPALAFELLRAAGAVIAACGREETAPADRSLP